MAVVGIGVDVVDVARFARVLARSPDVAARLFTAAEAGLPPDRLAVRFAAKEALAKALGAPAGLAWHDVEVRTQDSGRPTLHVTGTVQRTAAALGVRGWHVSLSHDGGMAIAMVVAES